MVAGLAEACRAGLHRHDSGRDEARIDGVDPHVRRVRHTLRVAGRDDAQEHRAAVGVLEGRASRITTARQRRTGRGHEDIGLHSRDGRDTRATGEVIGRRRRSVAHDADRASDEAGRHRAGGNRGGLDGCRSGLGKRHDCDVELRRRRCVVGMDDERRDRDPGRVRSVDPSSKDDRLRREGHAPRRRQHRMPRDERAGAHGLARAVGKSCDRERPVCRPPADDGLRLRGPVLGRPAGLAAHAARGADKSQNHESPRACHDHAPHDAGRETTRRAHDIVASRPRRSRAARDHTSGQTWRSRP